MGTDTSQPAGEQPAPEVPHLELLYNAIASLQRYQELAGVEVPFEVFDYLRNESQSLQEQHEAALRLAEEGERERNPALFPLAYAAQIRAKLANSEDKVWMSPSLLDEIATCLEGFGEVVTLRPDVLAFACLMETKLRKHDAKRGQSWKQDDVRDLFDRLTDEAKELRRALNGRGDVVDECVDVANFAMMVADQYLSFRASSIAEESRV